MTDAIAIADFDYGKMTQTEIDRTNGRIRKIRRADAAIAGAAFRKGVELIAQKNALEHGLWLPWLKHFFDMSTVQATNYMTIARRLANKEGYTGFLEASTYSAQLLLCKKGVPSEALDDAIGMSSDSVVTLKIAEQLIARHSLLVCPDCNNDFSEEEFDGKPLCPECFAIENQGSTSNNPNGPPMSQSVVIDGKVADEPSDDSEEAELEKESLVSDGSLFEPVTQQGIEEDSPFAEIRVIWELINKLSPTLVSNLVAGIMNKFCRDTGVSEDGTIDMGSTQTIQKAWEYATDEQRADAANSIDWKACQTKAKKKPTKFVPPTVEDAKAYAEAKGYKELDPEHFVAYYESQGWKKANGQKVTNWKLCMTTFSKQRGNNGSNGTNGDGQGMRFEGEAKRVTR